MLSSIKKHYTMYRRYRQTVSELSSLTDRDLADLGISRSDIRRIASESVR